MNTGLTDMYDIPVLLIIYNRKEHFQEQLEILRRIKPLHLFIFADGPKNHSDRQACDSVRSLVLNLVDWNCKPTVFFSKSNLGCGKGPLSAINWFFSVNEMGIILEDDCIPSLSFFRFCRELLIRYENDSRVWQISGTNRLGTYTNESEASYTFTNYASEWGWATWRRAWRNFDYSMRLWANREVRNNLRLIYHKRRWFINIVRIFDETFSMNESITWWDYQWLFAKNINSGLSIVPLKNLVMNIGTGPSATHTNEHGNKFMFLENYEMDSEITHPCTICANYDFDNMILDAHFPAPESRIKTIRRISRWLKKLLIFLDIKFPYIKKN